MPEIIVRRRHAIGTLVLSNPEKHNAMTYEMWNDLPKKMAELDSDPSIRIIVLEGDGEKAFVSGSDISQFAKQRTGPEATERYNRAVEEAHIAAGNCSKPVVAKIRGICIGGGVGLSASCDIRLCADNARFRIPAARIGIGYPSAGIARLLPLLGPQNAMDILFSARYFDAAEAFRLGLVAQVWPAEDFDEMCEAWLTLVSTNAPLTIKAVKRTITAMVAAPGEAPSVEVEALITDCFSSSDYVEGQRAFAEKRIPNFEGR